MPDSRKRLLFEKQAKIVQAIGHPLRLEIIDFLKEIDCQINGNNQDQYHEKVSKNFANEIFVKYGHKSYERRIIQRFFEGAEIFARCLQPRLKKEMAFPGLRDEVTLIRPLR